MYQFADSPRRPIGRVKLLGWTVPAARHWALAVGLATGCSCWETPTAPSRQALWDVPIAHAGGMLGAPAILAGALLAPIGPEGARMQALDAATGTSRWTVPMLSLECAPFRVRARDGVAFIASCGGATAYDAVSGQVRWTTRLPDHPNSFTPFAVDSVSLYLADRVTGRLSALDVATGVRRWTWRDTATSPGPPVIAKATVAARGRVYLLGVRELDANRVVQGILIEFDGTTGTELRRFTTPDSVSDFRAGAFDGGHRIIIANRGRSGIDAFDVDAWRLAWRVRRNSSFAGPTSDPTLLDGVVYAGWQHADAVAIDLETGRELWSTGVQGGIYNVVACKNEVVAQHFALTWFDRRTGRVRASNPFEGSSEFPTSDLVTDGERVYAISDGRAYAYRCE